MRMLTSAEIRRIKTMDANLQQFLAFSKANPGAPLPWNEWAAALIIAIAEDAARLDVLISNER